ncbi:MAG: type II toxin-antitoxin system RelE/ParE family toxin [Candidatus Saccharibacteria bacterium]
MAKRIIWSRQAERVFNKILEFYMDRNGSKAYSRKLNQEIHELLSNISRQPFIGIKTENKNIRVVIKGNYKIFYKIEDENLIILLVWDSRQDQESVIEIFKP